MCRSAWAGACRVRSVILRRARRGGQGSAARSARTLQPRANDRVSTSRDATRPAVNKCSTPHAPFEIVSSHEISPSNRKDSKDEPSVFPLRSEEHTSELQSRVDLVCRLLLEKKKKNKTKIQYIYNYT